MIGAAELKIDHNHRIISRTGTEVIREEMDEQDKYWFWIKFQGLIILDTTIMSSCIKRDADSFTQNMQFFKNGQQGRNQEMSSN